MKRTSLIAPILAMGLGFALLVGGCSLKLPGQSEPPRIFSLSPKSSFDSLIGAVDWQLLIERPSAGTEIDTQRIAVKRSPLELLYFERALWTDTAPLMVQHLLVESFENSGKIIAVDQHIVGLRADYVLKSNLREMQIEYLDHLGDPSQPSDKPFARIALNAKLIKMPQRRIIDSRKFEYVIEAQNPSLSASIEAFDDALGKIIKRLVPWVLETSERHWREQRSRK
ncbi:MAG: ABC-type transport auxiliary lipoprotein family protein [Pseudomonadota bacterium]